MNEAVEFDPINKLKNQIVCPVEFTLRIMGGKWRGSILYQLKDESLRFSELKYRVQDAVIDYADASNYLTNKVLSSHLKELIAFHLVQKREDEDQHTVYELTPAGLALHPILIDLFYWGEYLMKLPSGNLVK